MAAPYRLQLLVLLQPGLILIAHQSLRLRQSLRRQTLSPFRRQLRRLVLIQCREQRLLAQTAQSRRLQSLLRLSVVAVRAHSRQLHQHLPRLHLHIRAGEVLGIVGRSGSGKSTLTKLVQRLYVPERGRVLVDGNDLALANPAWLRRQVGVVLQENVLLNRSVRDNIALADPGMPLERVMHAAKLAGAHGFIMELPEGYDTMVGEQGAGLSGGQRIAIARALVGNPRILILDEATSALDYESERAIMQQMQAICRNRTVLIIAHRLSTVRMAHRIIAMDKGQIVEQGTHQELLAKEDGYYRYLHQLQNG